MDPTRKLRQGLRPLVYGVRRARQALLEIVRPAESWDGRHHPALSRFPRWQGEADGRFLHDFLGVRTDVRFRPQFRPDPAGPVHPDYPPPHAGYFEWVFVLESVLAAANRERFTMVELGAGFGPWLVTAAAAMRRTADRPLRLIGVELVPEHVAFMREHFRNNGLDPDKHRLLHGAVGDRDGTVRFLPEANEALRYGTQVGHATGGEGVEAPCFRLDTLLADADRVDLMHVDVQGAEERALQGSTDALDAKVHRLIVATHSAGIHRRLRAALTARGWRNPWSFRPRRRERTAFGDIRFLDGLLAAVNPRLD